MADYIGQTNTTYTEKQKVELKRKAKPAAKRKPKESAPKAKE